MNKRDRSTWQLLVEEAETGEKRVDQEPHFNQLMGRVEDQLQTYQAAESKDIKDDKKLEWAFLQLLQTRPLLTALGVGSSFGLLFALSQFLKEEEIDVDGLQPKELLAKMDLVTDEQILRLMKRSDREILESARYIAKMDLLLDLKVLEKWKV